MLAGRARLYVRRMQHARDPAAALRARDRRASRPKFPAAAALGDRVAPLCREAGRLPPERRAEWLEQRGRLTPRSRADLKNRTQLD